MKISLAEETPPQPQKKSKEPHSKYDIIPEDELADVELQKELQSLGLDDVDSGNKKDDISDFKFIHRRAVRVSAIRMKLFY